MQTPTQMPLHDSEFVVLNFVEVCQWLSNETISTLLFDVPTKEIPCYKVGGFLRFERSEVIQWIKILAMSAR